MATTLVSTAYFSCMEQGVTPIIVSTLSTNRASAHYEVVFGDGSNVASGNTFASTGVGDYSFSVTHTFSAKYVTHLISFAATATDAVLGTETAAATSIVACREERDFFMDGPVFSPERAIEFPVVKALDQYDSAVAEGSFVEASVFTRAMRHSVLVPFAGESPIFNQAPESVKDAMFVWNPTTTSSGVTIVSVAFKGSSGTSYLTPDGDGALVLRVLPDTPGEITGLKCAPYPDKTLTEVGSGPVVFKLSGPSGSSSSTNHLVAKNPYSGYTPPVNDLFPGEPVGETDVIASPPTAWSEGSDQLRWLDKRSVQFGFRSGENGTGVRFYLEGCTYETVLEMSVLPIASVGAIESGSSLTTGTPTPTDPTRLAKVLSPGGYSKEVALSKFKWKSGPTSQRHPPGTPPAPAITLISAGVPTQAAINAGKVRQSKPRFGMTSGVIGGGGVTLGGHITGFWLGSNRIMYFGTQGDKIRWYPTRKCGEPIPYVPKYGDTLDAFANPGSTPRECLVGIYDSPPIAAIESGPSYQGLMPPLISIPEMLSASSVSLSLERHCVDGVMYPYYLVDTYITGGTAPFTVNSSVTYAGTAFSSGPVNFNYATETLPVTITGVSSAGGTCTVTSQVEDAFGVTVTSTGQFTLVAATSCQDSW